MEGRAICATTDKLLAVLADGTNRITAELTGDSVQTAWTVLPSVNIVTKRFQ